MASGEPTPEAKSGGPDPAPTSSSACIPLQFRQTVADGDHELPVFTYGTAMANGHGEKQRGEGTQSNPDAPQGKELRQLSSPSFADIVEPLRVYQIWPGKNVFFFGGRLVCGPDPRGFILTSLAISFSNWVFCAYVGDGLVFTFSVVLTILVLVSLIAVSSSDPGIVSRNEEAPLEEDVSRSKRISINGVQVKRKYCRICKLFRPPRSCHCAICDNCVERFDHHCIWIGQCIGQHNYRSYVMFISMTFIFYAYIFSFSWWAIKRKMSESGVGVFDVMGHAPEIMVLTLFSFIAIWFLGGLTSFHIYLISINQTSYENFRGRHVGNTNPYHKGVLNNIKEILFAKLPSRKVNFRAEVQPGWFPADLSPEEMPENGFPGEKGGGVGDVGKQRMKRGDALGIRTPSDAGSSSDHFEDVDLDFKT